MAAREFFTVTVKELKANELIKSYIKRADEYLGVIGYTEHGERHANLVSKTASEILERLGLGKRSAELAAIAGYLHDIGNVVNRDYHAQTAALLAQPILLQMGMPAQEMVKVIAAIGNHHEEDGVPVSEVAAAVILADKSDVHRSRVRNPAMIKFDIHDRVNYAVQDSFLQVDESQKILSLRLTIDTKISSVMEYFEIFLSRMIISRRAADFLGCRFELVANETKLV